MILYLLRFSISVILFYGFHKIILQNEKNYLFNRVFLVFGLIASLGIPLISISGARPVKHYIAQVEPHIHHSMVSWESFVLNGYYAITAFLVLRFVYGVVKIVRIIQNSEHKSFEGGIVVLMKASHTPFSFLHYVFVSQDQYEKIEPELMEHELAHVRQWHTLDLFFIELLQVFFWFNPVLVGYKRSMQLNHEFLADDAVLSRSGNVRRYQEILLTYLSKTSRVNLSSGFNFALTRRRLQMMTRDTNKMQIFKQVLVVPFLITVVWACSDNEGVSGKEMLKYWRYTANMEEVLQTGMMNENDLKEGVILPIENREQYDELQNIYNRMNKAQKESVFALPGYLEPISAD